MSRTEAEQLLESEPMGTFLVRLSEKIWGYAISYKDVDRCKHYLINASTGQYKFLGANQLNHASLSKFKIFVTPSKCSIFKCSNVYFVYVLFNR